MAIAAPTPASPPSAAPPDVASNSDVSVAWAVIVGALSVGAAGRPLAAVCAFVWLRDSFCVIAAKPPTIPAAPNAIAHAVCSWSVLAHRSTRFGAFAEPWLRASVRLFV